MPIPRISQADDRSGPLLTITKSFLTAIAFLAVVHDTEAEAAGDKTPTQQSSLALKPCEIGSISVKVGAFAVVTYWRGEGPPLFGDYRGQLSTARGFIQAIDGDSLTLTQSRGLGPKQIAIKSIRALTQSHSGGVFSWHTEPFPSRSVAVAGIPARSDAGETGERIDHKLIASIIYGFPSALLGAFLGGVSVQVLGENCSGDQSCALVPIVAVFPGWVSGYSIGTAIGVSSVDPDDRFFACLAGSLVGVGIAISMLPKDWSHSFRGTLPFSFGSTVGSIIASELFRKRPESPRLSIGLAPGFRGSFFAATSLRF